MSRRVLRRVVAFCRAAQVAELDRGVGLPVCVDGVAAKGHVSLSLGGDPNVEDVLRVPESLGARFTFRLQKERIPRRELTSRADGLSDALLTRSERWIALILDGVAS